MIGHLAFKNHKLSSLNEHLLLIDGFPWKPNVAVSGNKSILFNSILDGYKKRKGDGNQSLHDYCESDQANSILIRGLIRRM